MSIAIMSVNFGRTPYALPTHTAEWMGRLKVKPGSLDAAESRMPSRH
jgi:hypothetical protein